MSRRRWAADDACALLVVDAARSAVARQIAQTLTPELVLQPRYQQHRNGARSIREVILCDSAPEQIAATYAQIAGHPVERRGDDFAIDLGRGRLTVVAPDRLGALIPGAVPPALPYLAGFVVTVDDLAQPRAVLRDAGVPFVEQADASSLRERRVRLRGAVRASLVQQPNRYALTGSPRVFSHSAR